MGEPEARRILREEREKATAERKAAERKPVTSQEAYEGNGSNEELLDILTSHGVVTDPDEMHAHALRVTLINWRNASSKGVADMYQRAKAELSARIEAESADAEAGSYAGRAEAAEFERNEQRTRATIAEAAATALRGQRNAAKDRAEQAEAEVARLREANAANAAEYDAALLAIHAARDHWQNQAAAEFERAEQAEAALAEMRHERKFDTRMFRRILEALDEDERSGWSGDALSRLVCDLRGDICDRLAEREADAAPRTALERAADEQGGNVAPEDDIDIDAVIAQNHADAMRDWGIAEQGDGGGG